jgi:anti-sigma factor RsiW
MKCEKIRSEFMEAVLGGPEAMSGNLREHLQSCAACSEELASFERTMSLLDEWQTPEPSPYFTSRLRARVREQAASWNAGWLAWLRRPAVATAAVGLIALGVGLLQGGNWNFKKVTIAGNDGIVRTSSTDAAVSDLQYLDRNADLFTEFDALDGQSQTE